MTKFKALATAVVAAFAVGNANALFITVDDFNSASLTLADLTLSDGAVLSSAGTATPSGVSREVSHDLLAGTNSLAPGAGGSYNSYVTVGADSFPTGRLQVSNGSERDSEVKVLWTLGAGFLSTVSTAKFGLNLLSADGNPATVSLGMVGGPSFGSFGLGTSIPTPNAAGFFYLTPEFNAAQLALINAGGVLEMTINGPTGWDLSIDSAGFETSTKVPEPTSLALVGLALLGAGFASRRRPA